MESTQSSPDVQIRTFDKIKKWFLFNRLTILNEQYKAVKEQTKPSCEADRLELNYLSQEFEKYHKRTTRLSNWRVFFYGVVLFAGSLMPFVNFFVGLIDLGNVSLGAFLLLVAQYIIGIAFAIVFILTVRINLNIVRMQGALSHLVAIYSTNKKRDAKKTLQRIGKVI